MTEAMSASERRGGGPNEQGWNRRRLLGILAAVLVVAVSLVVGLGYWAYQVIASTGEGDRALSGASAGRGESQSGTAVGGAGRRDEIAAAPMLTVPAEAMHPAPPAPDPAPQTAPRIRVPAWTVLGPASVLTGFPQTPTGAVGQLAQIEATVLQSMSLRTADQVYQAWALPGGIGSSNWGLTSSVQAFLDRTQMGETLQPAATVTVEPAAALVKGTDGPTWVAACVLMKVTAVYRSQGQVAFGHCERMQWVGGRWMIAPGRPPAPAPSTWPRTAVSNEAGWRTWATDGLAENPVEGTDGDAPMTGTAEQESR